MLKHILKKARLFFLLIILSVGFFSACSVPRYNYYYATLETKNPQIEKTNRRGGAYTCYIQYFLGSPINDCGSDSLFYMIELSGDKMEIKCLNDLPIYFDFEKSTIEFNGISYKITPSRIDSNKNHFAETLHRARRDRSFAKNIGYIDFPISKVNNLYDKHNDMEYKILKYTIGNIDTKENNPTYDCSNSFFSLKYKTFILEIPTIQFLEENSPLKIDIKLVYYTDLYHKYQKVVNFDFYQSKLMKLAHIRYDKTKNYHNNDYHRGDVVGLEIEDVSFYTKNKSGTIWGWPEFRRGLGWGATVILPSVDI